MTPEIILDIVLSCLLGAMQLSVYAVCVIWRIKKYRKGLHYSTAGFGALFLSSLFGVFLPIGGFTFLDAGEAGTKSLITAAVFCPILLTLSIRGICYCVFLDGRHVVKRTLFSEIRIDLGDPGTTIDDSEPFSVTFWISISCPKNQTIQFNSRRIEGDLAAFLQNCKKIQNKK